jgi:hypothetical protein
MATDKVYADPWSEQKQDAAPADQPQQPSPSGKVYDDPWAGGSKASSGAFTSPGEKKYGADTDFIEHEKGFVPDELKTFAYSAGESGLFGLPSLAAAANRYYSKNISWDAARKEQQEYIEALQRQHPNWSMAGTAAGVGGSFLLPAGPLGTIAKGASGAAEAAGAGKLLQTVAGGAGVGAASGALSSGVEDYMKAQLSPESVGKGALIGGVSGGVLAPAFQGIANRFIAPATGVTTNITNGGPVLTDHAKDIIRKAAPNMTDAEIEQMTPQFAEIFRDPNKGLSEASAKEAILKSSGITDPSATMATGMKAPAGSAARGVAEELQGQAESQLKSAAQQFATPNVSPTAGAEGLAEYGRQLYDKPKGLYKTLEQDKSLIQISPYNNIDNSLQNAFSKGSASQHLFETGQYDGATEAYNTIKRNFMADPNTGVPARSLSDTFAILQKAKSDGLSRAGNNIQDRNAVNAIIDGFKNSIQEGILNTYSGGVGSQGQINALQAMRADADWSKYIEDLFPKQGVDSQIFSKIMKELAQKTQDGRTIIDPNPTQQMLNSAQNVINANLLRPGAGRQIYDRLEQVMGSNSSAMNNFNALIRNQMMDVGGDFSKLNSKIQQYTSPDMLPMTLKAFGADAGNLGSLAANNADSAATQLAKQKVMELRRLGMSADTIYSSKSIPNEEKPSVFLTGVKKVFPYALGFLVGGHTGSILSGLASYGAGEAGMAYKSFARAATERAGAPRTRADFSGGTFQRGDTTYAPGIRDITALAPPETPPDYASPTGRASGGRVVTADELLSRIEKAGKEDVKNTKPLLNLHDNTVAKALEIANKHI